MGCFCFCLKGRVLVKRYDVVHQPKNSTRRRRRNELEIGNNRAAELLRALEKNTVVGGFEERSQSEQEDILTYLSMNWEDLQQDSSVIEALKETSFVTSADGGLYRPRDLFDPGDKLLKSLFSGEPRKFPNETFGSDTTWLKILRKTGLQNTREADTVLQCARKIEFLGAENVQVSLEIWSLANTLVNTILKKSPHLLHDHSFCSVFGKIACVPAKKGFPFDTGKNSVTRVLCSYSDAILLKDWPLAWSAAPILSIVPPDYSWEPLQLRSPPPFTLVLKHLQVETCCTGPSLSTVETTTFEVLKYLEKIWETLSASDILELQQLAFIAADNGTRLATPGSLFTRLRINLSPLASELPSHYLPFVKILKELGVEDLLSVSSATSILSNLHKSCGYNRLNPNQLRAVIELLQFLCDETIEPQTSDTDTDTDRPVWESELVVPDDGCNLVRPDTCVYIDPHGSKYVNFIDSLKLRFVHHDVSERLCLAFGIRKLSNVVVEELDNAEHLQTLEKAGSVSLAAIRLKLLSSSFQVAVSSVVNNFSKITLGFKNPDFLTLQRSLKSVAEGLKFAQDIYTRFWLLPQFVDITKSKSGSSHHALYYVDRSYTCMIIAEQPNYASVVDLVAIVVSHVLGSPVPLPIGSLFLCPQDSETALVNILLKLPSDERVMEGVGLGNGFLGRHLLPRDEKQVKVRYAPFCKGEIVGWRSRNGDKLKYGRISEDVKPLKTQPTSYTLKIETSPGMITELMSSNAFHFRNKEVLSALGTPVESDSTMQVQQSQQRHATKELELGKVPAEELDKSVEEMFSVSEINMIMDTEKQCLLQTTLSLHHRLNESQAALGLEQEKSKMATEEANTAKRAMQCRICFTTEIDITIDIVPCGHVLCRTCTSDITCCPFCGVELYKKRKLYRP